MKRKEGTEKERQKKQNEIKRIPDFHTSLQDPLAVKESSAAVISSLEAAAAAAITRSVVFRSKHFAHVHRDVSPMRKQQTQERKIQCFCGVRTPEEEKAAVTAAAASR